MTVLHFLGACLLVALGILVVVIALLFAWVLVKGTIYAMREALRNQKGGDDER